MMKSEEKQQNNRILKNIALISAAFAMIMCVLIIVNFIQVKRADPLNAHCFADGELR